MPPRRFNSGDELSLRHLPDTTDTSFSFQISTALSGSDRLLDEDDMSFFRGANDDDDVATSTTSATSRDKEFTLDDLAPRMVSKHENAIHHDQSSKPMPLASKGVPKQPSLAPMRGDIAPRKAKSGPGFKLMTQDTGVSAEIESSAITTLEAVTVEVQVQVQDNDAGPSKLTPPTNLSESIHDDRPSLVASKRERPVSKPKRTVISGGISKARSKIVASSISAFPRSGISVPGGPQQTLPPPQTRILSDNADFLHDETLDTSMCSTAPGGVAERLVMYSQTLLTSFGPAPLDHTEIIVTPTDDTELLTQSRKSTPHQDTSEERSGPLTLSQISPSKPASTYPTPVAANPPDSPMRQSRKRPASSVASFQPAAKKGRSVSVTSDKPSASVVPASQRTGSRAPAKNSSSSSASQTGQRTTQRTREARGVSRPTRKEPSPMIAKGDNVSQEVVPASLARNDAAGSSSGSSTLRFSRSDNTTSGSSAKGHGEAGSSTSTRRQERVALPPANPTKSIEFKFQVDARIEARKTDEKESSLASQKSRKQSYHPVPDFKTIHAAEEARLALRKENIVPVVPLPFQLSTDERAHEREKFEEHLREKERELERAIEQKRREEEENEEREIRELRKKAVPRAHEVPEWYKEVPKKKSKDLNSSRD
ncbi:hypothetical protein C0991_001521 [Blastosporella zonata]|nr:hypothetical protein C0991_001521 [Blastosporella zonata]